MIPTSTSTIIFKDSLEVEKLDKFSEKSKLQTSSNPVSFNIEKNFRDLESGKSSIGIEEEIEEFEDEFEDKELDVILKTLESPKEKILEDKTLKNDSKLSGKDIKFVEKNLEMTIVKTIDTEHIYEKKLPEPLAGRTPSIGGSKLAPIGITGHNFSKSEISENGKTTDIVSNTCLKLENALLKDINSEIHCSKKNEQISLIAMEGEKNLPPKNTAIFQKNNITLLESTCIQQSDKIEMKYEKECDFDIVSDLQEECAKIESKSNNINVLKVKEENVTEQILISDSEKLKFEVPVAVEEDELEFFDKILVPKVDSKQTILDFDKILEQNKNKTNIIETTDFVKEIEYSDFDEESVGEEIGLSSIKGAEWLSSANEDSPVNSKKETRNFEINSLSNFKTDSDVNSSIEQANKTQNLKINHNDNFFFTTPAKSSAFNEINSNICLENDLTSVDKQKLIADPKNYGEKLSQPVSEKNKIDEFPDLDTGHTDNSISSTKSNKKTLGLKDSILLTGFASSLVIEPKNETVDTESNILEEIEFSEGEISSYLDEQDEENEEF
ncbi:hypothetical protein HK096_002446 [Nowakowskiella sp. JEL0078]|nr:hypothetical protein HK096_002446 [Nowakowskiella sp. JEL0078]